jgi:hypothetical protein
MAKRFNPFHHWLGFDENLMQPNHFQLFGVKPNSDDPIGFRKKIHHRAKAMLKTLEAIPAEELGEHQKLHTRLRRHIVKAHETLLDDKKRAAYLKGLRQKAREEKGSAKPLAVPPPQLYSSPSDAASASQTSKGEFESQTIKGGSPTIKQSGVQASGPPPAVPMAIPLSKPNASAQVDQTSQSYEVNFDHLHSEQISIRPGRVKRKKSWLIPVALAVMTLFCIAGIAALVSNFGNKFGLANSPEPVPQKAPGTKTEPGMKTAPGIANPAESPTAPTPEEIRRATEELVNSKTESSELSVENMVTPEEIAAHMPKEEPTAEEPQPNESVKPSSNANSLTDPQLHSIRHLFKRARNEMKRGHLESAAKQYNMVESILQGRKVNRDQVQITQELKNGRGMVGHLEGFFDHVKYSSQKITGGELEPEPGVYVGFVEGRPDDVVVRIGENVAIPYRSLSPGLAMALASKKGAKNLPDYRLDQAAYRIIHTVPSPDSDAKTEELIAASEADGYDASSIRGFWKTKPEAVFPNFTMTDVPASSRQELVEKVRNGKYESVDKLAPELAGQFAIAFSSVAYDDPSVRIAALYESIGLAERSGDAALAVDLIDELHNWTEIDAVKMKVQSFIRIIRQSPETADPRAIGDAFYEFLKSDDVKSRPKAKLNKLRQQALVFVEGNRLLYLKRLISQTAN